MENRETADVIRLIGLFRAMAIHSLSDILLATSHRQRASSIRDLEMSTDGVVMAGDALGIEIDRKLIIPSKVSVWKFSDFYFENAMLRDSIAQLIDDTYGDAARFNFIFIEIIAVVHILSSGYKHMKDERVPKTTHGRRMLNQRTAALEAFATFRRFLTKNVDDIRDELGVEVAEKCAELAKRLGKSEPTPQYFRSVEQATGPILAASVPQYSTIAAELNRGLRLIRRLRACAPGRRTWREFETIVVDILRFLFVPPFRKIIVQSRTSSAHEIRDAVLPNNHFTGFWSLIRQEFGSKHIVCEMKNNALPIAKADLHQLRIYLSKPTIGRFGLLLHRGTPSPSALEAQRTAYEQSQILILLLNEDLLQRLLKCRAYIGKPDVTLEDLKADFELRY